ncbi:midnolin-like isoform X1 [Oreochromis aureus]|uniref:Ubiquitin-like domain-containing protein n=1 Tax=Oreochromis aureus TaxID=47969 RepID=A0A668RAX1_OREAU|nr:midnolin-like isoform X1 [Oreochromis aureus]
MEQQQRGLCSVTAFQCASRGAGVSSGQPSMRLCITSTAGSPVELTVPRGETVEALKARISQKLRLHTDRIVLLHKDRHLTAGTLLDQGVTDGSKLTLVPVIEAGLLCSTARAERTVMDVLESLTEVQINDFLSGRSPLNINLGIGAHVMCVELQLSAQDVKELQLDSKARGSSAQMASSTNHPHSASAWTSTTGPATSSASQASSATPFSVDSLSSFQFNTQGPRTSLNSQNPSVPSSSIPATNCCNPSSLLNSHSEHGSPHTPSPPLPCGSPHPGSPLRATAPVCSAGLISSSPAPLSPTAASTFTESNANASSTAQLPNPPGAVIESFVRHSPGIFSGTFSGTLAPCSQSGFSHPRRGVAIILQILNDLLKAAYHHQGAPVPLPLHRCPAPGAEVSPLLTAEEPRPPAMQRTEALCGAPGDIGHEGPVIHSSTEENQTLHCKLEHLQLLMHERRLRRRARKTSHISQSSHPYQKRHHHP